MGRRFEVLGSYALCLDPMPRQKQKQTLSGQSWEPLFRKFPGAQQPLPTPRLERRGPKGSGAGRDTPAREFRHRGSGQSVAPAFPACPQTPDPAQHRTGAPVSSGLTVALKGEDQSSLAPGRGYSAGSTFRVP